MAFNHIPVFTYHSVAPVKSSIWYKSFLTYRLDYFEDLLKYLVHKKYEFLTLDEYFAFRSDRSAGKRRLICLTFDDGYLDNYVFVYPLLKRYNAKGTIFVSPDYAQDNSDIRPTLEDVWAGRLKQEELQYLGFISWKEMKVMEATGVVDIQSHTMTHTKYYSGYKIREFHHPGADYLYPVGNLYPEKRPYYITNPDFINLVPYGTPFFEETSSIICKRVFINSEFEQICVDILKNQNWEEYSFSNSFSKIKEKYDEYVSRDFLVTEKESEFDYYKRVEYEISESKSSLEKMLNKTINHICWPHGDYNDFCHATAMKAGFKSSHIVLRLGEKNPYPDRFDRTGSGMVLNNRHFSLLKAKYKIDSYRGIAPYSWIRNSYNRIRYSI